MSACQYGSGSRNVAREHAWLSPTREGLYSPASSSLTSRLLPALYIHLKGQDNRWCLGSLDVSDAFLTVDQVELVLVTYADPEGQARSFILGKMLPGQRDGTARWREKLADDLKMEVSATVCSVSPNIFRCDTRLAPIYLQTHVDDIEYVGMLQAVDECLIPAMEKSFKISNRSIIKAGDEMDFLKRRHVLRHDGSLLIMAHPKH